MARYNEIQHGRFARGVQRIFGVRGEVPVASLAGEVSVVWELFTGLEDHFPQQIEHFSGIVSIAANAANTPGFQIRNPANSGVVATIEKLLVSPIVAQDTEVTIGSVAAELTTSTTSQNRDGRGRPVGTCVLSSSNTSPAALGNPIWLANGNLVPIEVIIRPTDEIVLFAGGGLRVTWSAVNQAVRATIYWRERVIEDAEKT